ncbi:hypothetical protein HK104_002597 [Borealophlyctis nickersoniae]|nr:hypothetical protein HK104_002597 [Borealophlyctis nickersoniae]
MGISLIVLVVPRFAHVKIHVQEHLPVRTLAVVFTLLVFFCATQDIAVDGWALTLLTGENKPYASTAQTIGLNTGYFLSFTVFLALNSADFCNSYVRSVPAAEGLIPLGGYLKFWGFMFLVCDAWLIFFKKEKLDETEAVEDIKTVYSTIWDVCQMPHMRQFMAVLLVAKIGFIANESVTPLKLLDKGFHKEDVALSVSSAVIAVMLASERTPYISMSQVLIDFPFQILFGYYAAKWSTGPRPLKPWLYAFYGRLAFAVVGMLIVKNFPQGGATTGYFFLVMVSTVLNSFTSTVQFVGMGSFFTRISDPLIGGTYMTLLNTLSNLGGTWPKYFILKAVDFYTDSSCTVPHANGHRNTCGTEPDTVLCKSMGGTCEIRTDGYYIVGIGCVVVGLASLVLFIKPMIEKLEALPERTWRLKKEKNEK